MTNLRAGCVVNVETSVPGAGADLTGGFVTKTIASSVEPKVCSNAGKDNGNGYMNEWIEIKEKDWKRRGWKDQRWMVRLASGQINAKIWQNERKFVDKVHSTIWPKREKVFLTLISSTGVPTSEFVSDGVL